MKVKVIERGGRHGVEFSYGNQFFILDYIGTKNECRWMEKMLRQAFKKYKNDILTTK